MHNKQDMMNAVVEVRKDSQATLSYGLLHMDTPVLADQWRFTLTSSVQALFRETTNSDSR